MQSTNLQQLCQARWQRVNMEQNLWGMFPARLSPYVWLFQTAKCLSWYKWIVTCPAHRIHMYTVYISIHHSYIYHPTVLHLVRIIKDWGQMLNWTQPLSKRKKKKKSPGMKMNCLHPLIRHFILLPFFYLSIWESIHVSLSLILWDKRGDNGSTAAFPPVLSLLSKTWRNKWTN